MTGTTEENYKKEARLFYFATDTAYGLKVAWSGTTGPYPDSLKLGYNRKEFAWSPLFFNQGCGEGGQGWTVKMPSYYATIDNASGWETLDHDTANGFDVWQGYPNHVQFFATGKAASTFAKRASVRQVAFENMAPDAAKIEAGDLNGELLNEIRNAFDDSTTTAANKSAILSKAVKLGLVNSKTTSDNFLDALKTQLNNQNQGSNYLTSTRLNELRVFAVKQKE